MLYRENMEQKELREWEARCIQEEPPLCRAGCPLAVDARAFSQAMAKDNLSAALAILEKGMPLAAVTARMCEAPCEEYCVRGNLGGAIAIGGLERTCIRLAPIKRKRLLLPPKSKKVAVFGSGPSSLTVAFDLARKGYPITLFHLPPAPGSWLRDVQESDLPQQVLEEEIKYLESLGVRFCSIAAIGKAACDGSGCDAVYIGRDDEVAEDLAELLAGPDEQTFALARSGWFTGGLCSQDHVYRFITDISQGRQAAVSIDRFLQGASLTASRVLPRKGRSNLFTETSHISVRLPIVPADAAGFSREEAVEEAGRCIDCQCLECVRHCVYLAEYGSYPKAYARRVYNNSAIVKGVHQANTFINSCSLCRQCEVFCPNDFSMADLCLTARELMVLEKRMPPSAHWFALEEMNSAGNEGALIRHAPVAKASSRLFFPGCQLAGIRPEQVLRLYDSLCGQVPETGIWLDCCAAPAHWAGEAELFARKMKRFSTLWGEMGSPPVITACSSCLKMFRENLPEMPVRSVWEVLAEDSSLQPTLESSAPLALTDPCTSRHDEVTRNSVRTLLTALGQRLASLPMSGEVTECCGFGGLMENADPALARKVVQARVDQSEADFLTYCAMCRDQLAKTGKPVVHLLDLLFPDIAHPASEQPASLSLRRVNRRQLKSSVLKRYSPQEQPDMLPWEDLSLAVAPEVAAVLDKRRILEDDIRQVLYRARQRDAYLVHGKTGNRIASARLGEVTFWVEYREKQDVFRILRCWSHRMTITGEQ